MRPYRRRDSGVIGQRESHLIRHDKFPTLEHFAAIQFQSLVENHPQRLKRHLPAVLLGINARDRFRPTDHRGP
jgi:hypothetical protein